MKALLFSALCAMMATTAFAAAETKTEPQPAKKDVVLIVACHPDDIMPVLGFCHMAKDVYDLHVVDFTHGERGCGLVNFTNGWTKATRTKEETAVCATFGGKLHWLDEVDGEAYACRETCHKLADLIKELKPRAVITHWPVDIHTDHVMTGAATLRAVFLSGIKAEVWFMGQTYQSKSWTPDVLLDISPVWDKIFKSIDLYVCQSENGGLAYRQKVLREYLGYQSRRFYDAKCEGFKALVLPMAGDHTIFTDLPQPKNYPQGHMFEGAKD